MTPGNPTEPVRIWGIPASESPVVGVIARYPSVAGKRWTCVLKWNTATDDVEVGAWTTLRLSQNVCALSPDGEYLFYTAAGPLKGPFSRMFGGGVAISRLPWLSALTDIRPASVVGGGPSKHALSDAEQERLWRIFAETPWYSRPEDWPRPFGPKWSPEEIRNYPPERVPRQSANRRVRRIATANLPGRNLRLVVIVDRVRASADQQDKPRFFLECRDGSGELAELPGLRWAHPMPDGQIAAATLDGRLQRLVPTSPGDPASGVRARFERDLTGLRPTPAPSPARARAPLNSRRRKAP